MYSVNDQNINEKNKHPIISMIENDVFLKIYTTRYDNIGNQNNSGINQLVRDKRSSKLLSNILTDLSSLETNNFLMLLFFYTYFRCKDNKKMGSGYEKLANVEGQVSHFIYYQASKHRVAFFIL
jgi:hypothetical protein